MPKGTKTLFCLAIRRGNKQTPEGSKLLFGREKMRTDISWLVLVSRETQRPRELHNVTFQDTLGLFVLGCRKRVALLVYTVYREKSLCDQKDRFVLACMTLVDCMAQPLRVRYGLGAMRNCIL
jgi:hypothetical protein